MAKDPQAIQAELLKKGMADANNRIMDAGEHLDEINAEIQHLQASKAKWETAIQDAKEEVAAIQSLLGTPILDPGA